MNTKETDLLLQQFFKSEPNVPQGMEQRLETLIDTMETAEAKPLRRTARMVSWRWAVGVAASVLLVLGVANTQYQSRQHIEVQTTEETLQVTTDALMLFSETLNEGMNTLQF